VVLLVEVVEDHLDNVLVNQYKELVVQVVEEMENGIHLVVEQQTQVVVVEQ
jgi:hypothetical protein